MIAYMFVLIFTIFLILNLAFDIQVFSDFEFINLDIIQI